MDIKTSTTQPTVSEKPTGLEDVMQSVQDLARSASDLGKVSANVVERELALAVKISAQLRDDVISKETLEEARKQELPAKLRKDAEDTINLIADFGAIMLLTVTRFLKNFTDQSSLNTRSKDANAIPKITIATE